HPLHFHSSKFHSISTPLRGDWLLRWRKLLNSIDLDSTPWTLCSLFSIDAHIPKLDVTGSKARLPLHLFNHFRQSAITQCPIFEVTGLRSEFQPIDRVWV